MTSTAVRFCLVAGSLLGGVAVAAGAFGAHGLAATLAASGQEANWQTACTYCMYHALGMLAAGLVAALSRPTSRPALAAGWCFLLGTLIFSGCLAALALSGVRILGAIVPVGGVLMIAGWVILAAAAARLPPAD
ncbi:MAG: DUF423 domain-containing protein [Planctomycetota bacterium]